MSTFSQAEKFGDNMISRLGEGGNLNATVECLLVGTDARCQGNLRQC